MIQKIEEFRAELNVECFGNLGDMEIPVKATLSHVARPGPYNELRPEFPRTLVQNCWPGGAGRYIS